MLRGVLGTLQCKTPHLLVLGFVLFAVGVALYTPLASSHSRYFYHEDDAHHFNRTVEMAQRRDLNPHYFNKPALHFYLRMPVVYMSVAYERLRGRIESSKDIRTRDPYGLAGYAYTPSHPRIVMALRFVSIVWTCLLTVGTFYALHILGVAPWIAITAPLLVLISPEVVRNSYVIGVDILMALLCLATALSALISLKNYSRIKLTLCALLAGLACASKYNAAPICLIPACLWLLCDATRRGALIACLTPIIGFLLGAPYSLLSPTEFWNGLSYEAWHYGVAGHEGNSTGRGLPQLIFYSQWLLTDGVGVAATILSLIGGLHLWQHSRKAFLLIASFPIAYAALMIMQKTHFSRNMVALVPFAVIACGCGIQSITQRIPTIKIRSASAVALVLISLISLATRTSDYLHSVYIRPESRDNVAWWLSHDRAPDSDVSVAGPLQLPISLLNLPGVDAFNPQERTIPELIQQGYSFFIVPTQLAHLDAELTEILQSLPGNSLLQRVPSNPAISILRARNTSISAAALRAPASMTFTVDSSSLSPICPSNNTEPYCWVSTLVTQLNLPELQEARTLEMMSPWPNQVITLTDSTGMLLTSTKLAAAGTWESVPIPSIRNRSASSVTLTISQVHSPLSRGLSADPRRLGVAIRHPVNP